MVAILVFPPLSSHEGLQERGNAHAISTLFRRVLQHCDLALHGRSRGKSEVGGQILLFLPPIVSGEFHAQHGGGRFVRTKRLRKSLLPASGGEVDLELYNEQDPRSR